MVLGDLLKFVPRSSMGNNTQIQVDLSPELRSYPLLYFLVAADAINGDEKEEKPDLYAHRLLHMAMCEIICFRKKKKEIMCFKCFASHFYNSIDYHTDSNDVSIDCHLKTGMMDQK